MTVRARAWDCPSCGLDKRRRLAEMCAAAGLLRMVTLTLPQPLAFDRVRQPLPPPGFDRCDRSTHVARNPRDGIWRWRTLSSCPHCCRKVSAMLAAFRKRLRRQYGPQVQYLWAREDHPVSGGLHLHLAMLGLPPVTRRNRAGRWMKRQWNELGGGFVDLGLDGRLGQGDRAGWYLGKYLAKRHDQRMARGYRRWTRTQDFAPEVRMTDPPPERTEPPVPHDRLGWLHPVSGQLLAARYFDHGPEPGPVSQLEPMTLDQAAARVIARQPRRLRNSSPPV